MPYKDKIKQREAQKRYKATHPQQYSKEKNFEYKLKYKTADPLKYLWYSACGCAKRQNWAVYTLEELKIWHPVAILRANGRCESCLKFTKKLLVDHCHKTGKLRGLLCRECNLIEGLASDAEHLKRVASYMEKHTNDTNSEN